MSGKFSNDAGTHQSMYALRDRDLRLALHFRELRPAVSGETGKASVVDGGFFAALLTPGSQCDRQHDDSSRKYHSVLKKGLHRLVSCTSYLKPEREACILRMRQVTTIAGLAVVAWGLISGGNLLAATVPQGFTETIISGPWTNAVGVAFEDNGRMYVWEGTGQVWFKDPGDGNYTLLLDIHDEVGKWGDHGMLGFALDPDFRVNGYIYVLYVVDRYYLFHSGDPDYDPNANEYNAATIGRRVMVCPVILTTTLPTRGRRALGFGLWDCAIRFAWACSPIRAVIFHPTAIPGSCTLGMLVGVLGKHWTWWLARDRTLAGRPMKD